MPFLRQINLFVSIFTINKITLLVETQENNDKTIHQ